MGYSSTSVYIYLGLRDTPSKESSEIIKGISVRGQNLTWSGVYLRITLSNALLQKVMELVPMTATRPEVYVDIVTTFLSSSYDALEETLTHTESLKLNIYPGDSITDFCAEILVEAERLESAGAFNAENLGYFTRIFEDTSDSRFCL